MELKANPDFFNAVFCLLVTIHSSLVVADSQDESEGLFAISVHGEANSNIQRLSKNPHANERVRRQALATNRDKRGFNEEEKRIIVKKHNDLRRLETASDMNYMFWDDDLEALAQDWAENCDFSHRPERKNVGSFSYAGENLYAGTHSYDPDHVIQAWYDEVKDYNYDTLKCTGVCGHYTQVVWATSYAVGCGVAYCPVLRNVDFRQGWHVACNYGPGGNYVGQRPYKRGERCSQCEKDAIFCVNGLCSRTPVIEAAGRSSHAGPLFSFIVCLLGLCNWLSCRLHIVHVY